MEIDISEPQSRRGTPPGRANKRGRKQIGVSLQPDVVEQLDVWAQRRGLTRSGLIAMLITEGLERWRQSQEKPRRLEGELR